MGLFRAIKDGVRDDSQNHAPVLGRQSSHLLGEFRGVLDGLATIFAQQSAHGAIE